MILELLLFESSVCSLNEIRIYRVCTKMKRTICFPCCDTVVESLVISCNKLKLWCCCEQVTFSLTFSVWKSSGPCFIIILTSVSYDPSNTLKLWWCEQVSPSSTISVCKPSTPCLWIGLSSVSSESCVVQSHRNMTTVFEEKKGNRVHPCTSQWLLPFELFSPCCADSSTWAAAIYLLAIRDIDKGAMLKYGSGLPAWRSLRERQEAQISASMVRGHQMISSQWHSSWSQIALVGGFFFFVCEILVGGFNYAFYYGRSG